MEKIFNWSTTVPRETLIEKINELSNIVLDNTTKGNKLFTEIDKSSFYTDVFPDLFKLTVTNKDGKVYNPDDPNDKVFEVSISDLNLETYELGYSKYGFYQPDIKHISNEIDNRIVNAYLIARMVIDIVNYCSAKYKFFQPKECDLYNACHALVEFVLYLRLMDIEPKKQFSTLIKDIDSSDRDGIQFFYIFAHRLGIPLLTGEKDIFLEQLFNRYYRVQQDESGYYSAEKAQDDTIYFELADEYSAPSDKYFTVDDKKIQLVLNIDAKFYLFKKDLDFLLNNGCLDCFKFTCDIRGLYEKVGGYNISGELITKDKYNGKSNVVQIAFSIGEDYGEFDIHKDELASPGYYCQTIIDGVLPRSMYKFSNSVNGIVVIPILETEFSNLVKNILK